MKVEVAKKISSKHLEEDNFASRTRERIVMGQVMPSMEDEKPVETFARVDKKKTSQDIEFISKCLKSHFVFYRLSDSDRRKLASAFFYCSLKKDEYVIK